MVKKLVDWCRKNVSIVTLSGSALVFVSMYSLGILYAKSHETYGVFKYRMAAFGLCMIIGDAMNVMIYKTKYPMETFFPVENESRPVDVSFIFPAVETICSDAVPCLTCSLYVHYDIAYCGRLQLVLVKIAKEVDWFYKNVFRPQSRFWSAPFIELFLAGNMVSFGLLHDNQYAIMAAASYQMATLLLPPGNYYSRKKNRVLYNFLMIPYVAWMTRALLTVPVKVLAVAPTSLSFLEL